MAKRSAFRSLVFTAKIRSDVSVIRAAEVLRVERTVTGHNDNPMSGTVLGHLIPDLNGRFLVVAIIILKALV